MRIEIRRQRDQESPVRLETFSYDGPAHVSALHAIEWVNDHPESRVSCAAPDGTPVEEPFRPVVYEASCEQGICGACAMLVNGRPRLACKSFLDVVATGDGLVRLSPLSKFPLVSDLMVNRAALPAALVEMKAWQEGDAVVSERLARSQYEAGLCLMCGCCLEACPNYAKGDLFCGATGAICLMNAMTKESDDRHREEVSEAYRQRFYPVCTKSGACEKVCPAGLPTMSLISEANRASVWGFWRRLGR